jgi:hypothetical protein
MNKKCAKESPHVQRTRSRLKKRLHEIDTKVTPNALREVSHTIYQWLRRHEGERIPLSDRPIKVFDENQHPEKVTSQYIQAMIQDLAKEIEEETTLKELKGRIQKK